MSLMDSTVSLLMPSWLSWSKALLSTVLAGVLYYVYWLALPRPLPGIPYNKTAVSSPLGDLPEMIKVLNRGRGVRPWFGEMAYRHKSPIIQFFPIPFGRPLVVVVDYRESQDIITHRTKEIDRGAMMFKYFGPIIPDHHIAMSSTDTRFRANKELVKDLMSPSFLSQVSGPSIYTTTQSLVELWNLKADMAKGRPFSAFEDIHAAAMDIILSVSIALDIEHRIIEAQRSALSNMTDFKDHQGLNEPVKFPHCVPSLEVKALMKVTQTLELTLKSPIPEFHHWILRKTKWRKAFKLKENFLTKEINKAAERLLKSNHDENAMKCAMDHMILREVVAAEKARRPPQFQTPRMRDELFGYILAGHETTSTTLAWIMKFLADQQSAQARLRQQLHEAFKAAISEKRQPTVTEITKTAAPYLDAFLEESLRHSNTLAILTREATADTTILGHSVPKGSTVLMYTGGPSISQPAVAVPESTRSVTSHASKDRVRDWEPETVAAFEPQRWLTLQREASAIGESRMLSFDSHAGPSLPFGAGPRGCFGKRLAYLELRIVVALLVWNFEFEQCVPELSSYDGIDMLTTFPKQCFVKLRKVDNL